MKSKRDSSRITIGDIKESQEYLRTQSKKRKMKEKLEDRDNKSRIENVHLIKHVIEENFLEKIEESLRLKGSVDSAIPGGKSAFSLRYILVKYLNSIA